MRTFTKGMVRVLYPDAYSYVFNPMVIEVSGIEANKRVAVVVAGVEVTAMAFKGVARFDVSQIAQTVFSSRRLSSLGYLDVSDSPTSRVVSISVPIVGLSFTTLCVWGALQTDMGAIIGGDCNNDFNSDFLIDNMPGTKQSYVWHYGLPFTVSVPMTVGTKLMMSVDGKAAIDVLTATHDAIVNVTPELLLLNRSLTVVNHLKLTLISESTIVREYDIAVNYIECNKVYLRWIDKKGYYCYWAFGKVSDACNCEKQGVFINAFSRSIDYVDGFNGGDGRQQGKKSTMSLILAAELVDDVTWSYLLGVTQSPIVDVYTQNDYLGKPRWLKTDVATGSMARGNSILSDFNVTISLPSINNQLL